MTITASSEPVGLFHRGTIVAVDDASDFLDLLAELLEAEGFRVVTCNAAEQGYRCVKKAAPDLLILDVEMPPAPNWLVLDMIKLDPRTASIPVIICSGATREIERRAARLHEHGCMVVTKPFELTELLALVEQLIR